MVGHPSPVAVPEPETALTTRPVWDWDASELDELEWWRPGVLWSDRNPPRQRRARAARSPNGSGPSTRFPPGLRAEDHDPYRIDVISARVS
jgi:hypothetical protein